MSERFVLGDEVLIADSIPGYGGCSGKITGWECIAQQRYFTVETDKGKAIFLERVLTKIWKN